MLTSMDEVFVVNKLNPSDHLICQHENCLHGKPPGTEVEQVFQTRTQQIHHQNIVVSFLTKPVVVLNDAMEWMLA